MQVWSWGDMLKNLQGLHHLRIKFKALHMVVETLLVWPSLSLHHDLASPPPLWSLFPYLPRLCLVAVPSTHTHVVTLLWFHTFGLFSVSSSRSPHELSLKFLLMNHQFYKAFPWTSLQQDFPSALYTLSTGFTLFPGPASLWAFQNLQDRDHVILFLGASQDPAYCECH